MSYNDTATITAPTTIRYLGCTLLESLPTTSIITIVTSPPGDSTNPAQVAVYPYSVWTSCGSKFVVDRTRPPAASITTKPAPNWRVATIRTSIIGFGRFISQGIMRTKAAAQID